MPEPKILNDNIPHEYILMPNIKYAFDPEGVGLNWSLEECEFKKGSNQYISVFAFRLVISREQRAHIMRWLSLLEYAL